MQAAEFDADDENDDNAGGRRTRFGGGMLSDALSGTTTTTTTTTAQKKIPTVTSALQSHLSSAQSRLSPTIDALCAPLTTFLSNNPNPSTASCLALAYLSLLLIPSLPVSWMQQFIRERYPTLSSFVERGVRDIYAGETDVEEAMEGKMIADGKGLPWRKPEIVGAKMAERMIWGSVVEQLPSVLGRDVLHDGSADPEKDLQQNQVVARRSDGFVLPAVVAATTAIAAIAGYLTYTSYTTQTPDEKGKKLSDMGEAGALFSALDFGHGGARTEGEVRARVLPVGVEMGVSADGGV